MYVDVGTWYMPLTNHSNAKYFNFMEARLHVQNVCYRHTYAKDHYLSLKIT